MLATPPFEKGRFGLEARHTAGGSAGRLAEISPVGDVRQIPLNPPFSKGEAQAPAISNGRLGMMLLIGTETILFSSFIGAYLVLRMSAPSWPPAGTPVLHLGWASLNTALLVVSALLLSTSLRSHVFHLGSQVPGKNVRPEMEHARRYNSKGLIVVFSMGVLFLFLQVLEFHRLYARGLTLQTGPYGALFYSLITCHGLHVLGGLAILGVALSKSKEWLGHAEIYWHFVTGVWLVLFGILYLW